MSRLAARFRGHLTGCFDHSDSEEDEPQLPAVKDSGETEELPDKDRGPKSPDVKRKILWAFRLSWAVNWLLTFAKLYAFLATGSKSVLASFADSIVDLASQGVISVCEFLMARRSPKYPIGRARLEALGVIGCAVIMAVAAIEVIQTSCEDLKNGFSTGQIPDVTGGAPLYVVLLGGVGLKLALYLYCRTVRQFSDSVGALAEDHLNDVASNTVATITAAIAVNTSAWYIDPIGAVVISLWIIYRWINVILEQIRKVVGRTAPPAFVKRVAKLADEHHVDLRVDNIRAYFFGARHAPTCKGFNVELEVLLPPDMTVAESHDIGQELQHKVEALDEVERCFVHIDHEKHKEPVHKVERQLLEVERSKLSKESDGGGHRRGWWRKGDKDEVRGAENGGEGGAEEAAKKAPKAAKLAEATQDGENTAQEAPQQAKAPPEIVIDRE